MCLENDLQNDFSHNKNLCFAMIHLLRHRTLTYSLQRSKYDETHVNKFLL